MRLACDSCGEVGELTLELAGAGHVKVTCAHCGAQAALPLAAPSASPPASPPASPSASPSASPPADADDEARRCPKCHAAVGARAACPGCGLSADRMVSFSASRAAEIPPAVLEAWHGAHAAWEVQARHDAFVQAVAAAGAFAWAAGQYQDELRRRPGDPIATRQLERVRRTAEAAMLASAAVRQDQKTPYRSATAILVMLVVVLVAGALYATFMRDNRAPGVVTPVVPVHRGARSP